MSEQFQSPQAAAEFLASHGADVSSNNDTSVSKLDLMIGSKAKFEVTWSSTNPTKWDWVALYASSSAGRDDYLTWEWVSGKSSWSTGERVHGDYVVRYFTWDSSKKEYVRLATTEAFPESVGIAA